MTIANACRVLAGWYSGRDSHAYDVNDGITFATTRT